MKKAIFIGNRLESCRAYCTLMKNYEYSVDIVTFKKSYIDNNMNNLEISGSKIVLDYGKEDSLRYLYDLITKNQYSLLLSAGFPYILGEEFFKKPLIYINAHPHILPKHKGAKVITKSFKNSEKEYGVTVHYMTKKVDDGEILIQKKLFVKPTNLNIIYSSLFCFLEPAAIIECISSLKRKEKL